MKIQVKVKPNAKEQKITTAADGSLMVSVRSAPVDGKANQELISLLAQKYQVSKTQISLKSGHTGRYKWVEIAASPSEA